ncbi:MAG: 2',3'-cyclic-nucleotide 2'-phosphodiesterase [Rhodobacteraceae bacterium PARR1]|nr:MAG: 2',3'-cyclic-nucleotide 2'-phosphodiesterase [Rhodobacteraceae bacterium PARR1]
MPERALDQHGAARSGASALLRLRILSTTDLHAQVLPWDYASDRPAPGTGIAALSTVIAAARAEFPNSLLLDNGDFLQGSALGDLAATEGAAGQSPVNPVVHAMNALGYDAGTLGNHDFSHGLPHLIRAVDDAGYPVVCANAIAAPPRNLSDHRPEALSLVAPWAMLDRVLTDESGQRHRLRIGVTGFLPPQTALWERGHLEGRVKIEDILTAARRTLPRLRAEGADIVVVLAHSGIGSSIPEPGMENAALALAALPGVDAVVMGHTHLIFPQPGQPDQDGVDPRRGTLAGKPAVMAGAYGARLGVIDLLLERGDTAAWRVLSHRVETRPAAAIAPDPAPPVLAAHLRTLDWVRTRLGRVDQPMTTHFALIAPSDALRLLALAQGRHVAEALRDSPMGHLPVLSAVAPFKAGGRGGPGFYVNIPPGDLLLRHVLDLYPHPNTLTALRLTGAEIAQWLERAAGLFHRITPGVVDQPLINPDFPAFNFDLIHGLEFRIDLSQPSRFDTRGRLIAPDAQRITHLTWRGAPLNPAQSFIVATNCYRSNGGSGFAGTERGNLVLDDGIPVRDVVVQHLRDRGSRLPPAASGWGFAPMPGTSVTFLSSPAARDHLLSPSAPEPLDLTPDGFLRFRLRL